MTHERDLDHATDVLARSNIEATTVIEALRALSVAAPSWALGTGGTRFARFPIGGEPRTTEEKIDDVAMLNSLTASNRSVSLHVPWDDPSDPQGLREHAEATGIAFDCMNSNTFQDQPGQEVSFKFGSLAHTDPGVRKAAVEHNRYVIELGRKLGSNAIVVWLADGTNHPGQASFSGQFERVLDGLQQIYASMPDDWHLYTEHKPYEPAFYSTVVSDWGSSMLLAQACGDRAGCIVDLGHHLPNTNIEQVVSRLAWAGRLGGFHFNDSAYGDDDLTTGSINPFQLFLIFGELLHDGALPDLAYMIDQSHNVKDPIEDLIQATDNICVAYAKAMCVDRDALSDAQERNDPAGAEAVLQSAYRTDVRPLVAEARRLDGGALDPLVAFRESGYREQKVRERGTGSTATGL